MIAEETDWEARANILRSQNIRLRAQLDKENKRTARMLRTIDCILAIVCRFYGEQKGERAWSIRLPEIRPKQALRAYSIRAEKDPESGGYIVICTENK